MLPSLLANDIVTGIKQFLVTGFEPTDDFFHGIMARFVAQQPNWMRGPFLQIGLPFRPGPNGKQFFSAFETQKPSYTHQEAAWQRLSSQLQAANTLVATGTGSGKTECFLYPLLEHCLRAQQANERGIKALIIYPMNALASDQARRFAEVIAHTPAFAKLRVGLFVGGRTGDPGSGMLMTETGVITDREALRKNPPDILLTNYKMLDYLLLRPKDRELWQHNTPATLRYVVVDELHTFDGAQGTDLALLLRRLQARLKVPEKHLICVGTSATLGGASNSAPLCEYARQIFGSPFAPDAVITENRLSIAEFLGDATIEHVLQPQADLAERLAPNQYPSQQAAVAAWFALFFPDLPQPATAAQVDQSGFRLALGASLKKHLLFTNLLKLSRHGAVDFAELAQQMQGPLPASSRPHITAVLDALLVLVAWARSSGDRPLVTLRVQLWLREMRRMVGKVDVQPLLVELRAAADLKASPGGLYMPLIQCSVCHTTGYLARLPAASSKVSTKLDEIYNTWFAGRSEAVRLYPRPTWPKPQVDGVTQQFCIACGNLQGAGEVCHACGHNELLPVFRTTGTRSSNRDNLAATWHDNACPACGARDRLLLLGARSATLGAQVVEHSWASPFNDDKKLVAFSDSVQDAAHRAGFFAARTYGNTVRTALAKAMDHIAGADASSIVWADFLQRLPNLCKETGSPLCMDDATMVAEFIGPNMTWQPDWQEELIGKGALPANSRLPGRVRKRLAWQAVAEMTYLSHRGRNLDRIGKATLALPLALVETCSEQLREVLSEQFGLRELSLPTVTQWLWGMQARLRQRGAVFHPELAQYAKDGKLFGLHRARRDWMPYLGDWVPHPVFLSLGQHAQFDQLQGKRNWYERWLDVCLGREVLLPQGGAPALYLAAIAVLEQQAALVRSTGNHGDSIALSPQALHLHCDVVQLLAQNGRRSLTVPRDAAQLLLGMPCLDAPGECYDSVRDSHDSHDSRDNPATHGWLAQRFSKGDLRRVIAAEHTGLLQREAREALEVRFKARPSQPWYENLLSATPTLEMGVDIGDLSAVLLCSVPPNQASYMQRIGRAGRRDGNAMATTMADGSSNHDLYFFAETLEMISGEVLPPGVFLQAAEVLRRQLFAFCLDDWVGGNTNPNALPDKTSAALDAVERFDQNRFPHTFTTHVAQHQSRLIDAFLLLLGQDLSAAVEARLRSFMNGGSDEDSLTLKLIKLLEEQVEERKQYKKRAERIKGQIAVQKQKPMDESVKSEIDALQRERDVVLELAKEINQRELLNTLSDAGLIPNYAFPEAGIELKSILWRNRIEGDPGEGEFVALPAMKFERPANSALSEFAPENRFYANQRRVEIDQINMSLAKVESWRMCPSCHHMENLTVHGDAHAACLNCGDVMWSDQAQRRNLLRFRQAIANSDDTKVRIDDRADDREPRFYTRQLLADFTPQDIRQAWRLNAPDLPFGFEFIAQVTFRDINFGELSKPGDAFKVADQDTTRPGFSLCRHCGKVQAAARHHGANVEQQHAFDCDKRHANDPASLLECLYLYREFSSEALRILVPYTRTGMDDQVVQSFMAALQLGLKRRFGGKVDHLRMTLQDDPGRDGGPRRKYVLLYDSVPGGTGYLQQLLAGDAGTLIEALRLALQSLDLCPCNDEPDKDGCYRCLYQYRQGRKMELVSRERAKRVLRDLLGSLHQLEAVPTISDIFINPNFDSVLEGRFIESLRRMGGQHGLPRVKLVQEIVNGKSGHLLEVGSERYWLEPQHELGRNDGIVWSCKPDFIIWPAQQQSARRPIAVFCDGWAYHRDAWREDAKKRSALVASGRFWVFSVTYDDVKAAMAGEADTDLESPFTGLSRHDGGTAPASLSRAEKRAFSRNAVAQLLGWLAQPAHGGQDGIVESMQRNSIWATFLMVVSPKEVQFTHVQAQMAQWQTRLPEWMQALPQPHAPAMSREAAQPQVLYWWPASLVRGQLPTDTTPGLILLEMAQNEAESRLAWRRWLALFNTLQTLPGMVLATQDGILGGDYQALAPSRGGPGGGTVVGTGGNAHGQALAAAWEAVLEQCMGSVQPGLLDLALQGLPLPEVGYEHVDAQGQVVAEAELAWPMRRLAVMLPQQQEYASVWLAAGWQALAVQDGWAQRVQVHLQVHLTK